MMHMEWTRRQRVCVGTAALVLLFLGLTGMVRFPAVVTRTSTRICLPDEGKTQDDYVQRTDCRGVPFIYRSCTTDWELRVAEPAP